MVEKMSHPTVSQISDLALKLETGRARAACAFQVTIFTFYRIFDMPLRFKGFKGYKGTSTFITLVNDYICKTVNHVVVRGY